MLTLAEMIARVQRLSNDEDEYEWTEEAISEELEAQWPVLLTEMLRHEEASKLLVKRSDWLVLVADTEIYDLPSDSLRIDTVQIRWLNDDIRYTNLDWVEPDSQGTTSGTEALFSASSSGGSHMLHAWDDVPAGKIRIWPYLSSINEEKYRFKYFAQPTFPTASAGTINDPTASGTATWALPDVIALALAHLTLASLGGEELEDQNNIGYHAGMYRARMNDLYASGAGLRRSGRHSIKRIRGRR